MDNIIVTSISDKAVLLTLVSEPKNSLTQEVIIQLTAAFEKYDKDPGVEIISFTGSNRAFCTGMNLEALAAQTEEEATRTLYLLDILLYKVLRSSKLLISVINGHAVGSGVVLALATDYRLIEANDKIKLGFPEYPKGISLPSLMREIISRAGLRSAKMLLMGELVNPQRASDLGLVDELFEGEEPTRLRELCDTLTNGRHNHKLYKQHFTSQNGFNMPQADDPEYAKVVEMVKNLANREKQDA